MSAREIVLKPITDKKVAKSLDKALSSTKEKKEALQKAKDKVTKKGFILK